MNVHLLRLNHQVAEPNTTWRVNQKDMKSCCYESLKFEMRRRKDEQIELMRKGDLLFCDTCKTEMICELGESNKLRWGLRNVHQL